MNKILKKVFSEKVIKPLLIGFGVFSLFTFIVFPGLTESNTIINIICAIIGVITLIYLFFVIGGDKFLESIVVNEIEPGETELDYIPKEEILKKKSNPKQSIKVGYKESEPFVKTRKKTNKTK